MVLWEEFLLSSVSCCVPFPELKILVLVRNSFPLADGLSDSHPFLIGERR